MGLFSDIIGQGLSFLGGRSDSRAASSAAQANAAALTQNADKALDAAQPWNIGSIAGTASFDPDSNTGMLGLSPELQNIYQGSLDRSNVWGGQAQEFGADPFAAGNRYYEQQQQYFQPQEDQLRTDAETRLLAQGRLGSTGGQRALGQLNESIMSNQNLRRNQSMGQAQGMIESLLNRETSDIGQATGMINIPMQQAKVGRNIGGDLGGQAAAGLSTRQNAAGLIGQANMGSESGAALRGLSGLFRK
jgi:hypothetical protein